MKDESRENENENAAKEPKTDKIRKILGGKLVHRQNNGLSGVVQAAKRKKKSTFPLQRKATNRSFSSRCCWSRLQSQRKSPANNTPRR